MTDRPANPWEYSNEEGYLAAKDKVRVYGFEQTPPAKLPNARCAENQPIRLTLQPGKYRWCSCGYSTKQPFCDGAHCLPTFNTTRQPFHFEVLEEGEFNLCRCKHTGNPPFCDATHNRVNQRGELVDEEIPPLKK